jgi:predicted dehydrogenase
MIAGGDLGPVHFVHGSYLQDWLLEPTDFSWRLEPDKGGASSAIGDIGSHWCDLVQYVTGHRIVSVLADLATVVKTRYRPAGPTEAFSERQGMDGRTPVTIESDDLATVLVRFDNGAKGCLTVGQVCAGHKNDLWFEINGQRSSIRWFQERQNELWLGQRHAANGMLLKDPSLLGPAARPYAHLPGGHQEAWSDAFRNVMHDIYTCIAGGGFRAGEAPAFPTFDDGYRCTLVVDAILESHRRGGVWTRVGSGTPAETR